MDQRLTFGPIGADVVVNISREHANIGVHGEPASLHLEQLCSRTVTITTGLVDTYTTPALLRLVTSHESTRIASSRITSLSTSSKRPATSSVVPLTPVH
jgi:hypothetical protein